MGFIGAPIAPSVAVVPPSYLSVYQQNGDNHIELHVECYVGKHVHCYSCGFVCFLRLVRMLKTSTAYCDSSVRLINRSTHPQTCARTSSSIIVFRVDAVIASFLVNDDGLLSTPGMPACPSEIHEGRQQDWPNTKCAERVPGEVR
jgi:hypothetical protein